MNVSFCGNQDRNLRIPDFLFWFDINFPLWPYFTFKLHFGRACFMHLNQLWRSNKIKPVDFATNRSFSLMWFL